MATESLGTAVLELTTEDSKLYAGIDKGEKAALGLVSTFDKAAKAITSGLAQTGDAAEQFSAEIKAAFTSVDVGSRGVSAAIQKMIGADAIERANAYAKAVTAIGGVSKLTAAEQQTLLASVTTATQKYTALGIAAPKALTDLAASTRAALGVTASLDTEATQLAGAISKVGGQSKLTKDELAKVSQITTELIGKYQALGREAPASLKALESESAKLLTASQPLPAHMQFLEQKTTLASKATDLLKGSVVQLASGFAIGNLITSAVGALVRWTGEAIEAAGATLDLSNKTGLSTDSIQKMEFAAKLTGATVEDFTNAAFKLGTRISGGSGSVRQAFEDLRKASGDFSVSWKELRSMNMDQQMDTVATALGKVENAQERNTLAVAMYGKGAQPIMAAIAEGWEDIASKAHITSREQLEAIDEMSDAWTAFVENRKKDIGSVLGATVLAAQEAGRLGFLQSVALLATQPLAAPGILAGMGAAANQAEKKKKPESVDLPTPQVESYVAALRQAEVAVSQLSKSTVAEIFAAEKLGKSQDEIINRYGITDEMLSILKARYSEQKTAIGQAEREAQKFADAQDRISSSTQALTGQTRETVAWLLKRGNSESDIAAALKVTAVQVKEVASVEKLRADALKLADKQAQEFVANQRKLMDASAAGIVESVQALNKWNEQLALQGTSGLNRQLIQIEQARAAELRAIENVGEVESQITKQRRAAIDEFYDHQRKLALGTADTIVERMHEQGTLTRSELRQQADNFKRDYDQMLASGKYTTDQLAEAWRRYHDAEVKALGDTEAFERHLKNIEAIGRLLDQIGRDIPGDIGEAISSVGRLTTAFVALKHEIPETGKAVKLTVANMVSSIMFVYGTLMQAKSIIDNLTGERGPGSAQAVAQRGGESGIRTSGATAGFNTDILLGTTSAATFRDELSRFDKAVAASDERLRRYGLTWQDLGDTIQQANIDQMTRQLVLDWRAFDKQGLSIEQRLKAMSGGLSQLVVDAVQTAQKIPAALRPMLESLIRSGKLTDAAARALLGMSADAGPAFKDVEAAAARYGIEIGKLGPKIQQLRINDIAKQIVADWNLLQSAGADTNTTLVGMQKAVQDVVTEARRAGVEIPEEMRPIIEAMARAGLLTDEFGNKLEDTSGLEFEKPLTAAIDDLIAKLDELIDKFSAVGTSAEEGFGRARGAATQTGTAIPRGSTGTGAAGGTGTGDSGTTTPPSTQPTGGTATPRSSVWNPGGTVITMPNGSTVLLDDVLAGDNGTRYYGKGGLVEPLYMANGGFPDWRAWAKAESVGWQPKGGDTIPAMLGGNEYVLDADTTTREGAPALKALQEGAATIVPSGAFTPAIDFKPETFSMPGLVMPSTFRSNTPSPANFGQTSASAGAKPSAPVVYETHHHHEWHAIDAQGVRAFILRGDFKATLTERMRNDGDYKAAIKRVVT